jgi:hypothetical protein
MEGIQAPRYEGIEALLLVANFVDLGSWLLFLSLVSCLLFLVSCLLFLCLVSCVLPLVILEFGPWNLGLGI